MATAQGGGTSPAPPAPFPPLQLDFTDQLPLITRSCCLPNESNRQVHENLIKCYATAGVAHQPCSVGRLSGCTAQHTQPGCQVRGRWHPKPFGSGWWHWDVG